MDQRTQKVLSLAGIDVSKSITTEATQPSTVLKEWVTAKCPELLGNASAAELSQWLSYGMGSEIPSDAASKTVDTWLACRSYVAGSALSVADFAIMAALAEGGTVVDATKFPNLARWYLHIRFQCANTDGIPELVLPPAPATTFPVFKAAAPAAAVAAAPSSGNAKDAKKDKKAAADAGAPITDTAAVPAAAASDVDVSKIAFIVGRVTKCWNHEESEKLLCEEVDCGEEKPRQIASGIRAHYSADQLEGRLVIVAANLKDRKIANFNSQGMVLCACNADHSKVALLEPPVGAEAGQRVTFEGYTGDAATPSQVAKKKLLEKVLPELKTDAHGNCCFRDSKFTLPAGVVTAKNPNAMIS